MPESAPQDNRKLTTPTLIGRILAAVGVIGLVFGAGSAGTLASADPGQEVVNLAPLTVSAAMKAHGPWGATYISADVVDVGNGPVWAFCTQAPVGGGAAGGTEADLASIADANSDLVRANANRIRAVLADNRLPDPRNVLRLRPGKGIFDWQENVIASEDVTAEYPLVHQYAQGPAAGHSYYDSLPLPADLRIELAAVQTAIWHYSDGFDPALGSYLSDQGLYKRWNLPWEAGDVTTSQVLARYAELVAAADAEPVAEVPSISIAASTEGDVALFEFSAQGVDPVGVGSSVGPLHPYDLLSGTCDTGTDVETVSTSNGNVTLCTVITSDGEIVATASGVSTGDQLVYIDRGTTQDLVSHDSRDTQVSAEASLAVIYTPPSTTSTTSTTSTSTTSTSTTTSTTTTSVPTTQPTTTTPTEEPPSEVTTPEAPTATVQRAVVTRSTTSSGSTGTSLAYTGSSATSAVLGAGALALIVGLGLLAASRGRTPDRTEG